MIERATVDIWVGLFVALGLAALLFLAMKVGNLAGFNVTNGYEVHAYFDNIGSLTLRAPVKSAGVVVGRVSQIKFDNQRYEADVVMKIDKRYAFPKDTSASILTSGLLGEQYIGLDPGGDDAMLKNGGVIKLTQSAVVLEKLIGQFLFSKAADGGGKSGGQ